MVVLQYLTYQLQNRPMDLFRRIGTDRHKFKVQFFIGKLSCNAKLKGDCMITIKRGDHKASSQQKLQFSDEASCDFNKQILSFESLTLFYDKDEKKYQQKEGEIRIIIITHKGDKKLLGAIEFDLAKYANGGKQTYQQLKKVGDKVKVVLEYWVYIKYLGEASEASKSIDSKVKKDKKGERTSSLSAFEGIFKKEQKSKENTISPKHKDKKKQKSPSKKLPHKKVSHNKPPRRQSQESQSEEESPRKNRVKHNAKGTMSEWQNSDKKYSAKNKNHTEKDSQASSPQIYFDQKYAKNQERDDHKRMKRTEKVGDSHAVKHSSERQNDHGDSFFSHDRIDSGPKLKPFDTGNEDNRNNKRVDNPGLIAELKSELAQKNSEIIKSQNLLTQYKQKLKEANEKSRELSSQLAKLQNEKDSLEMKFNELKNKKESYNSRALFETEREQQIPKTNVSKLNEEKLKALERQKGELLIKLQKQKERYQKDFEKYQETVDKLEEENLELKKNANGELARIKENFMEQEDKYKKLHEKYEERSNQTKKTKKEALEYKEKFAEAQNKLSALKLKIGEQLNQANEEADRSVINILTDLMD